MLQTTINGVALTCKPENLVKYQTKLAKPPKGGTTQSKEKRRFPNSSTALLSTSCYVREYLRLNNLNFVGGFDGYLLNPCPATWPEGEDCIVTIED